MVYRDYSNKREEMIPFFSVSSRDFDRDLVILKKVLYQFEQQTHSENAYIFSKRATMAAGWWFYNIFFKPDFVQKIFQLALPPDFPYHNKKAAAMKIVNMFQNQVKLNGSDARIKMYGDIAFATPWWSWLFR
jgi:hypothetical protein